MKKVYKKVVVIGAGFGGLQVAKSLNRQNIEVILVDKNNHHLFQPLLYQVASSALSPGEIAAPIRSIFRYSNNIRIIMDEAISIDRFTRTVQLESTQLNYDYLVLAPGSRHSYFGNNHWEKYAPGLKELNDALAIREKIISSFESAERCKNASERLKYLTFVIIGGGPTGVEMAGAISEIARKTMLPDYPLIDRREIKVILLEAGSRLLPSYPEDLSEYTKKALEDLGVEVRLNSKVIDMTEDTVNTVNAEIYSVNKVWAAGNQASPLLKSLDTELDWMGRVIVNPFLQVPGNEDIFVIGDAAKCIDANGKEVPGIAPAAIQQAIFVADYIISGPKAPFKYFDKGMMATIGKAKAVAIIGKLKFKGLFAWLLWSFIHVFFLIDFRNRIFVMAEWIWFYISNSSGARLIVSRKNKKSMIYL
jgi:NADH dehydrogenase